MIRDQKVCCRPKIMPTTFWVISTYCGTLQIKDAHMRRSSKKVLVKTARDLKSIETTTLPK